MSAIATKSPDTLPPKGYTVDQLAAYILRQLGSPTWNVELTKQQVLDCIQDALNEVSIWLPPVIVGNIQLVRGRFEYLKDSNMGPRRLQSVRRRASARVGLLGALRLHHGAWRRRAATV